MSRVVGYTRVSTDEQGRSGLGLEAQAHRILQDFPGIDVTAEVASGSVPPSAREALGPIIRGMRRGDRLVVARLDRLSRSLADFASLVEQASAAGWSITAIDAGVDTSTAAGEMMVNVMASFARYERRMIADRSRAAELARLSRDPEWVGRQELVRGLRADGLNVAEIVRASGLHRETVNRVLRRSA